jgi:phage/plasmid-like protein (TIGR03299 family)
MAHNLNIAANGQASFMYNKNNGLPWHGLGTPVNGCQTWREAIERARMNWTVSKRQLSIEINGVYQLVDAYGIFRDDNNVLLGSVGNQYTPIQNVQAFDFVDSLLESADGAHYDTAGVLFNGERIFVSATIPYSIAPDRAPDDKSHCYLMFETSHDGSLSATAKLTTVRVVCNNTLSMALNQKGFGTLKVRHSTGGHEKLEKAKTLMTGVTQSVETLKEKFNKLANRKIDKTHTTAIMNKLFGKEWKDSTQKRNQVERIATLFDSNDNNAFPETKGSAYSMLQSITNWVDHERSVRKTDKLNGLSESQVRSQSAVFAGGDAYKSNALEVVLAATADCAEMPEVKHVYQSAEVQSTPKSGVDSILNMVCVS